MPEREKEDHIFLKGISPKVNILARREFELAYYDVKVWFGLVSLINGISTFLGYLMPKPSL